MNLINNEIKIDRVYLELNPMIILFKTSKISSNANKVNLNRQMLVYI